MSSSNQAIFRTPKSAGFVSMETEKDRDSGFSSSPETRTIETPGLGTSGQDKGMLIKSPTIPKKKKKSPKPASNGVEEAPVLDDNEFNPFLLKKKKKKKASLGAPGVQLIGAEAPQSSDAIAPAPPLSGPEEYKILLGRFFALLHADHPELADSRKMANKRIPALVLLKESKKTIFASCPKLCEYLKRSDEHVAQYLFAELGTTGNFDGTRRLIIKGKFHQMQLETVIKRYMGEYVHCQTCKTLDTDLKKGENRLVFLTCNKCESRRSVRYVLISLRTNNFFI